MKYPAKSQTLPSIAKSLGEQGYTADMLYGGDINFTNMQSYFFSSGYSQITADRDFPLSSRLSKWGANDNITFTHLYESIRERRRKDTVAQYLPDIEQPRTIRSALPSPGRPVSQLDGFHR